MLVIATNALSFTSLLSLQTIPFLGGSLWKIFWPSCSASPASVCRDQTSCQASYQAPRGPFLEVHQDGVDPQGSIVVWLK